MRATRSIKVGIVSVFVDYHRRGDHKHGVLQPQAAPLIAGCLPADVDIEIVNDAWEDPDFGRHYDLVFLSALHPDFDRARQLSHYWRRRGARTVLGGTMASAFPKLCLPYFDAVAVGDAETTVPCIFEDFRTDRLQPLYVSTPYDPAHVPTPRFDLMAAAQAYPIALEASRGCTFACHFCVLTGLGVRYASRPPQAVVRDILAARRQTAAATRWWEWHKRKAVVFYDNNLGADRAWLASVADALAPLGLSWGGPITFDALQDHALMECCAKSGCRTLYTGLETFNPAALANMNKTQNVIAEVREVVDRCHRLGIMIDTGLLASPAIDTPEYLRSVPAALADCGLHVPTFVAFESPIPGTPHFRRLAAEREPALLPDALLRDFSGYTLVTRPKRTSVEAFLESYRWLCAEVGSPRARLRKLAHDLPRFLAGGHLVTALADIVDHWLDVPDFRPDADRSLLAGTDREPPEQHRVPFERSDFRSEEERRLVCDPWRVTDETGRVLPQWLDSQVVFGAGGRVRPSAQAILAAAEAPRRFAAGGRP